MVEKNFRPAKMTGNYAQKSWMKFKEAFSFLFKKSNSALRVLVGGRMVHGMGTTILFTAVPLFFVNVKGLDEALIPGIFSITAAVAIIGPPLAQKVAGKKSFRSALSASYFLLGILAIVMSLFEPLFLIIVAFAGIWVLLSMTDVFSDSALHQEFSSSIRASLSSFNSVLWAILSSISIFFAGLSLKYYGEIPTMIIGGILVVVSSVIYFVGLRD